MHGLTHTRTQACTEHTPHRLCVSKVLQQPLQLSPLGTCCLKGRDTAELAGHMPQQRIGHAWCRPGPLGDPTKAGWARGESPPFTYRPLPPIGNVAATTLAKPGTLVCPCLHICWAEEAPPPSWLHLAARRALPLGNSLPGCGFPGWGCQGLVCVTPPGAGSHQDTWHLRLGLALAPGKPGVPPNGPHQATLPFPLLACLRVHISSAHDCQDKPKSCSTFLPGPQGVCTRRLPVLPPTLPDSGGTRTPRPPRPAPVPRGLPYPHLPGQGF